MCGVCKDCNVETDTKGAQDRRRVWLLGAEEETCRLANTSLEDLRPFEGFANDTVPGLRSYLDLSLSPVVRADLAPKQKDNLDEYVDMLTPLMMDPEKADKVAEAIHPFKCTTMWRG
jgi:hypothetical protein